MTRFVPWRLERRSLCCFLGRLHGRCRCLLLCLGSGLGSGLGPGRDFWRWSRVCARGCLLVLLLGALPGLVGGLWAASNPSMDDLLLVGSDALYQGDVPTAERAFAEAVRRDPQDDFAMNQLGLALARQERFGEARDSFARVAGRSQDNVFARLWLGIIALHDNDPQQAAGWFEEVLERSPDHPGALYLLGVEAASRRDLSRAVELFARAGRSGRDDAETQFRLAEAYRGLGLLANAQLHYARTLEINPRHASALVGQGWLFYNQGRRDEALEAWTRAQAIAPGQGEARTSLVAVLVREGTELQREGRVQAARACFRQALAFEPGNKAALFYLH